MHQTSDPHDHQNLPTQLTAFLAALQFLTIFPPVIRRPFSARELGQAIAYYPLVGFLLGGFLSGSYLVLAQIFPVQVSAVLVLVLWVIASGALHLDGFLDTCDGLFGGQSPEKRLEIMRDERLGAFAFGAGALLVLLKYVCMTNAANLAQALLLAPTLSRWAMTLVIFLFPYTRSQGLGRDIKDQVSFKQILVATIITLLVVVLVNPGYGLIAFLCVAAVSWLAAHLVLRLLPGLTGDVYGAINEIGEVIVLLIFSAWLS
jgi:adenosylcobinamide-GDP ribazoletransferase